IDRARSCPCSCLTLGLPFWHVPRITPSSVLKNNQPEFKMDSNHSINNFQHLDAEVIVHGNGLAFAQEIFAGSHKLKADEPISAGGASSGPGPYEYLLAALGSCTSIAVTMYAQREGWPLNGVTVWLRHSKAYATDC